MDPYIFYLHDGPTEPPEFVLELCATIKDAKSRAVVLLAERPRYDRVEISLAEEGVATVRRELDTGK